MNLFDIKPTMTYTYRLSKDDVIDMLKDKLKEQLGDVPLFGTLALEDDTIVITVSTEEPKQPKRRGPGRPRKNEAESNTFDLDDYINELSMPMLLRDQERMLAFEKAHKEEALEAIRKVGGDKVDGVIAECENYNELTEDEKWCLHYKAVSALNETTTYTWSNEPEGFPNSDYQLGKNREIVVSGITGVVVRFIKLPNEKIPHVI